MGFGFFVSDVINGVALGVLAHFIWPRLKPLDGSVSLKFLLKIRLNLSLDTLDDMLGFLVQKL